MRPAIDQVRRSVRLGNRFGRRQRAKNSRTARSQIFSQVASNYVIQLRLEKLEERYVLSTGLPSYLPPTQFLYKEGDFLSPPAEGDALAIALSYISTHASDLGLT